VITRSAACPFDDWPYAVGTASQWPEASTTWTDERVSICIDAPRLMPADESCVAENVVAAVERSVRMHAFVRRETT